MENHNPFLFHQSQLLIPGHVNKLLNIKRIIKQEQTTIELPSGESRVETKVVNVFKVLAKTPTTILNSDEWDRIKYDVMTSAGRDILHYVIDHMSEDIGKVKLVKDEVCKAMNISNRKFYMGIKELSDCSILAKCTKSFYWVNPFYVFKGNVIEYFENHQQGKDLVCIEDVNIWSKSDSESPAGASNGSK